MCVVNKVQRGAWRLGHGAESRGEEERATIMARGDPRVGRNGPFSPHLKMAQDSRCSKMQGLMARQSPSAGLEEAGGLVGGPSRRELRRKPPWEGVQPYLSADNWIKTLLSI